MFLPDMRCPAFSFLLTVGLSGLIDGLPNPNPTTDKSRRQVSPDSYCMNSFCTPPSVPVFNQVFNTCGCKTIPPQCKDLICDALSHQSYDKTTRKCTCEFGTGIYPAPTSIPPYLIGQASSTNIPRDSSIHTTCPNIICGAGNVLDSDTCTCQALWPADACPLTKCIAGHHAVYNSTSGGCDCDVDCPDLMCTSGYTSFYNSSTRVCTCQKLSVTSVILRARSATFSTVAPLPTTAPFPTLLTVITDISVGPPMHHTLQTSGASLTLSNFYQTTPVANQYATASSGDSPEATASITPLSPSGTACRDLYCISEMTPQFNSVSGHCECVWIPGFGPSGT